MKKLIPFVIFIIFFSISDIFAEEVKYERIISLSPPMTENIYLLGAQDKLIGVTSYCVNPPEAQTKEIVGTLLEPNIEKIYALKPDLIITTKQGINPKVISKFQELGLNLKVIDYEGNFQVLSQSFIELGKILGLEERSKGIIDEVTKRLNDTVEITKNLPRPKVFWEYGSLPLVTASKDTFADDIIRYAGGENIFYELNSRYAQINIEEVIKRDPDFILIVAMGESSENERKHWEEFKNLRAVQNKRIFVLDAYKACSPTPYGFVEIVEELTAILHGLL